MRKIITAALLCGAVLMTGCGGSESSGSSTTSAGTAVSAKTPAERTSELMAAIETPEMAEVSAENLKVFYKIEEGDVTEFSAYVAGAGAYPDEFGVFVAKDADTAAAIEAKLEERIEKQRSTYETYSPDEMYKFDDSIIGVDGNTVYFAVCADNATAEDILG